VGSRGGHGAVVKMLLRQEEANSDHTEADYARTLLSLAAESRNFGLVSYFWSRRSDGESIGHG